MSRSLDYRRLHWSRWFRCESHHSLLLVPSKPGVFALAEEIMDLEDPVWERVSDQVGPSKARLVSFGRHPTEANFANRQSFYYTARPDRWKNVLPY